MLTLTIPFDDATDFTFPSTVEVTGGLTKLKLQEDNIDFIQNFDNDIGFTYDNTKSEFTGGLVRQKDTRPTNATFYASYTNNINGNWGNGVLTGTAFGGATISGGRLDLTGQTKYITYSAIDNWGSANVGCIRCKYTPNYSGNPSPISIIWSRLTGAGSSIGLMQLYHDTSGRIRFMAYNSSGISIVDKSTNILSFISGISYELELNYDFISGQTNFYVDGISAFTTATGTGITGTPSLIYIGTNFDKSVKSNSYIDDLLIFSTVQHTSNYTPNWTNIYETIYLENSIILPEMEHTGDGSILAFNSFNTSEIGSPRYSLQIGRSGNYLYWDGVTWSISNNTYAQSNTSTEFNTYCNLLDVLGEKYGQFKIIFPDSNTISSVNTLTVNMKVNIGYVITNPKSLVNTAFRCDGINSFIVNEDKIGLDEIKYILTKNNVSYYYNLETELWEISNDTYSQSNTAEEINNNVISFLSEGSGKYVNIKYFLHSNNGTTTPLLYEIIVTYNFSGLIPTFTEIIIYGFLRNINNSLNNELIKVRSNWVIGENTVITDNFYEYYTYDEGYFEISLYIEDKIPDYLEWRIKDRIYKTNFINQPIINFSDLTILWQNTLNIDLLGT